MKAGAPKRGWLALVALLAKRPRLFADDNDAMGGLIVGCFGQAFTQMIGAVVVKLITPVYGRRSTCLWRVAWRSTIGSAALLPSDAPPLRSPNPNGGSPCSLT